MKSRLGQGIEYAVVADKVPRELGAKVKQLELEGVGIIDQDYRTYPEGQLAAQVLGFVNADGRANTVSRATSMSSWAARQASSRPRPTRTASRSLRPTTCEASRKTARAMS
jgi:cell division protein FtsI/penicillin-binding protein 2